MLGLWAELGNTVKFKGPGYFLGLDQVANFIQNYNQQLWNHSPKFLFFNLTLSETFVAFLGPTGQFWRLELSLTFLPTHIDCQLLFWKYSHIFIFLILPHLGHFFSPVGVWGGG